MFDVLISLPAGLTSILRARASPQVKFLETEDLASTMFDDEEAVQDAKRQSGHGGGIHQGPDQQLPNLRLGEDRAEAECFSDYWEPEARPGRIFLRSEVRMLRLGCAGRRQWKFPLNDRLAHF